MKNKLNAFTLIDVLGAMLISSIIVGAALYFLIFVQDNQNEFENSSERKYKVELAYETLNRLFLKADDIVDKGSDVLFMEEGRKSTVILERDLLVINTGKMDSLRWELKDVETSKIKGKNTIKSIRIQFNFDTKAFEWYFYKNFGKSTLIDIVER
jgi:type II secretory pathway component PulJ